MGMHAAVCVHTEHPLHLLNIFNTGLGDPCAQAQTPIDPIDPFAAFSDALAHLQTAMPARYQTAVGGMDAGSQAALQAVLQYVQEQRQKAAAKAQP